MATMSPLGETWSDFERRHVWHPYASVIDPVPPYPVASAHGVHLQLEDGRQLVDGMASWWSAIHGYSHPQLNAAIEEQLGSMSHVMFGGLTHRPAVELAARLVDLTSPPLQRVFFSDSGSVAVEVALKMALQYWQATGEQQRTRFLSFRGGYHGDTIGAMSVSDPDNGMHNLFSEALAKQLFAARPTGRSDAEFDPRQIERLDQQLAAHQHELAGVIIEPLVQNAGGMHFYCPEYLRQLRRLCDQYGLLLIVDEIATGFGRTGTLFATEQAGISADILCIGKAIAGCSGNPGLFMHGPTFMANPLACAVACASIDLLLEGPWQQRIADIETALNSGLASAATLPGVADIRVFGAIGVVEMRQPIDVATTQAQLVEQGIWLRPFGKLLYTMPPFIIKPAELAQVTSAMVAVAANAETP